MTIDNNHHSGKSCSICGCWYPIEEFHYSNRENNSYCLTCNREVQATYSLGGAEAARKYRENKRATWQYDILGEKLEVSEQSSKVASPNTKNPYKYSTTVQQSAWPDAKNSSISSQPLLRKQRKTMSTKWPTWNEPTDIELLALAKIILPYVKFVSPEIVAFIVENNEKNKQKWKMGLEKKNINPDIYLWEKSPCVFPGVRRHSGADETNKYRKKDFTNIPNATRLDDNGYPKELWSWVLRDRKRYDRTNPIGFHLAHIFDHKDYKSKNPSELNGSKVEGELLFSGLYTSATNTCFVPSVFLKPTDHNLKLRRLLQEVQMNLYSSVCNVLPYNWNLNNELKDGWNVNEFEKPEIVGDINLVGSFLEYRENKIEEYLK